MCNRCKAAVTRRGAVMESCRCDGSSLHPGAVRQMEPQSHPLTSHPAGIRGRVNLVKAEWDTFKKLEAFERLEFLCYLNTTDRKMREGGKAVTFLPINDSECWSSLFFTILFFLCSAESLRIALYTFILGTKGGGGESHWRSRSWMWLNTPNLSSVSPQCSGPQVRPLPTSPSHSMCSLEVQTSSCDQ